MNAEQEEPDRRNRPALGPLESIRRFLADDILSGFDWDARGYGEIRAFFVSTIVAALIAWDVAFDLGAFHHVFFQRRHQLLVVAIVVVFGAVAVKGLARIDWWLVGLLAVPVAWIGFRTVASRPETGAAEVVDWGFLVLTLLAAPVAFWVLLRLLAPGYFAMPNRRLKAASLIIVMIVATLGYTMGELNNHFLTCEDFAVSGNDLPDDCVGDR